MHRLSVSIAHRRISSSVAQALLRFSPPVVCMLPEEESERMPDPGVGRGLRSAMRGLLVVAAAALAGLPAARAQGDAAPAAPFTEEQRQFFDEGPGWLWSEDERAAFRAQDVAGRDAKMAAFLAQDPIPETPEN